jgi:hypothetical protein
MRRLFISTCLSLIWAIPALAQDAPPAAPNAAQSQNAPNATQSQDDASNEVMQSIQQSIQTRLVQAGFTDIQMVPTSFLISAKDRDGHTVMLMVSPDSITQLEEASPSEGGGQDEDSGNGTPSVQPLPTDRSLHRDL